MIKKHYCIPPFTSEVYLDKLDRFCPGILKIAAWSAFFPIWISVSIFEEAIDISSYNDLSFEPHFSFLRKVKGFSNGVFRNLQSEAINCSLLSIKILRKLLGYY